MSGFMFNFGLDSSLENADAEQKIKRDSSLPDCIEHKLESKKIIAIDERINKAGIILVNEVEVKYLLNCLNAEQDSNQPQFEGTEQEKSDLIPGVYEGGFKIWECTFDLLEYLFQHIDADDIKDASVLDLGCGAGLLGISSILAGAGTVVLQDYNNEVIENLAIPNAVLNLWDEEDSACNRIDQCRYFSGDWSVFNDTLDPTVKFDMILSSETIYNRDNYEKLIDIFKRRLKAEGKVFLAAKTCYFGVGGGTREFEKTLAADSSMDSKVVWKFERGIQREILELTFKNK